MSVTGSHLTPPDLHQKHGQQLPLVRYALIAFVACGLGGFGLMGLAESWKQIESGHVVADDFIMLAMGVLFTLSALPILRNLGQEIHRDLQNRYADEIAALKAIRQRQSIPQTTSPQLTGVVAAGYGLGVALPLCLALLAIQHGEAMGDCLTVAASAVVCLLAPTIVLHVADTSRLILRWICGTLLGVSGSLWFVVVLGMATDQLSLARTDPAEITLVCVGLFVAAACIAGTCGLRKLYSDARRELESSIRNAAERQPRGAHS